MSHDHYTNLQLVLGLNCRSSAVFQRLECPLNIVIFVDLVSNRCIFAAFFRLFAQIKHLLILCVELIASSLEKSYKLLQARLPLH